MASGHIKGKKRTWHVILRATPCNTIESEQGTNWSAAQAVNDLGKVLELEGVQPFGIRANPFLDSQVFDIYG